MFTEEEKIRAIELYFKYGKKLAPVVRELGYPSKRNLRRWIRSWEAGCLAHARRKIHDEDVRRPTEMTQEALRNRARASCTQEYSPERGQSVNTW